MKRRHARRLHLIATVLTLAALVALSAAHLPTAQAGIQVAPASASQSSAR